MVRYTVLLILAAALTACGGRTQLVPAYQIGRLSSDAVVANDAGVRVVVRTDAWPGPPLPAWFPVELTIDNASGRPLRVGPAHVAFVTAAGERLAPQPPDPQPQDAARDAMRTRALAERVLPSAERVTGFVYFPLIDPEVDDLAFHLDLVDAATGAAFGRIEIPFSFE